MAYTPPVGEVNLNLTGSYTLPVGEVNLNIGGVPTNPDDRALAITALTCGASAAGVVLVGPLVSIEATTGGAIAAVKFGIALRINATTGGATAQADILVDPNLLSAVHAWTGTAWQDGIGESQAQTEGVQNAPLLVGIGLDRGRDAAGLTGSILAPWRDSPALAAGIGVRNLDATRITSGWPTAWRSSPRLVQGIAPSWQDATLRTHGQGEQYGMRPATIIPCAVAWRHGRLLWVEVSAGFRQSLLLIADERERWKQAGYPSNAPNPGPPIPPPRPWQWDGVLNLECPLPSSPGLIRLNIGRSPCPGVPAFSVRIRRAYRVINSCYLVRLPDRTPLPVTAMTVETDADSWCWALSATLASPAAWPLVQPQPAGFLPVEVEAGINGHVWQFLLDTPSASRKFGESRVSLAGRSRSAWLHDPFRRATSGVELDDRTAQQLAEQALLNTGWTLDWELPVDWLIPGGLYAWNGTPINQLIALATPVDGCLYTDPALSIITAYPRYPTPAWDWDGETADVGVPESAILNLNRAPENGPTLNGCYVSGTLYGYVTWVKVAGTDGALTPDEPVVDALLCDTAALRARGISILSNSGPGHILSADLFLTEEGGSGPGLLRPGLLAELAGVRGRVRSTRITAQWSGALQVRQAVTIERRETA